MEESKQQSRRLRMIVIGVVVAFIILVTIVVSLVAQVANNNKSATSSAQSGAQSTRQINDQNLAKAQESLKKAAADQSEAVATTKNKYEPIKVTK